MVVSIWNLRSRFSSEPNLQEEYGALENFCSLKIHHSGAFTKNRGGRYVDGVVDYYDFVDMDVFSIHELADMVKELGNQYFDPIKFYFHIPGTGMDFGLMPLVTDGDVNAMSQYVKENNLCEVFNSKIIDARDKPVITCLEYIREYLMKRIVVVQKAIDKSKGPLTPTTTTILAGIRKEATQNVCIFNGLDKTQVTTPRKDQYVVNLKEKTCTCRYWELTGIVCSHAVSAIWDKINRGAKKVPEIEAWVHPVYWLETWGDMYKYKIDPINGRTMWPKSPCPTTLTAPKHQIQVGRPKKKRKRAEGEVVTTGKNLSRRYITVTCSKCGNKGHNQRSCKGQGGETDVINAGMRKKKTDVRNAVAEG